MVSTRHRGAKWESLDVLWEVFPRVLWEMEVLHGVLQGMLPRVLNVGRQQEEHSRERSVERRPPFP